MDSNWQRFEAPAERAGERLARRAPTAAGERALMLWPSRPMEAAKPALRSFVHLLLVHGDPTEAARIAQLVGRMDAMIVRCDIVADAEAALRSLGAAHYDVCLVDAAFAEPTAALAIVGQIEASPAQVPVLLLVDQAEDAFEREALDLGAIDIVERHDLEPARIARALRLAIHRKRAALQLDRLAQLDGLTGLGNRVLLQERLDHALANARRLGTLVGVMMLDLNGFKAVNDELGHAAGDELLRSMAERMKTRLRVSDTIARVGGDEFAIVIENLQRPDQAAMVARKLLTAIAPAFLVEGVPVQVTGSLGVALFPRDAETGPGLLKLADAAMYAAKAKGGNLCSFHGGERGTGRRATQGRAEGLRRAIEAGELSLVFEPQQPLSSDRIGIGSIPCWQRPDGEAIEREALGRIAEEMGLGDALTSWLLGAVCAQARAWQKLTPRPFHLTLPILSRRQLARTDLAARIADEVQRHGLPRATVELEVDERLLTDEIEAGGAALAPLDALGIKLAVNQFSKASSMRILRESPVGTVRLHPDLVDGVPGDDGRTRFTRALLQFLRQLRLRVVAEGIESREQLTLLHGEGCDAITTRSQGAALTAASCGAWLAERAACSAPVGRRP